MTQSTIQPKTIEIDKIKNGVTEILVHWDITQIEREEQILYQYEECRMEWVLPKSYSTRAGVASYLKSIEPEVLEWAKGSKVTL